MTLAVNYIHAVDAQVATLLDTAIVNDPLSVAELNDLLDSIDMGYYESGACYDSDMGKYMEEKTLELEEDYQLSVVW